MFLIYETVIRVVNVNIFSGYAQVKTEIFLWCEFFVMIFFHSILDVDDASYTSNMPCSAEKKCSHAYIQNLAGCDAATNQCICQRGYALTNGLCTGKNFKCSLGS